MKEFIEIPFGAKDSELCGWEYTIPEGFVASIENGKIVVKKEENKDEKIRNEICIYIGAKQDISLDTHNRWLTWLEKQGEQKPAWSKEDRDYYDAIIAKLEVTKDDTALTDNQMEFLKSLKGRLKGE